MKRICLICFMNLILLTSCETKKTQDDKIQVIDTQELIRNNTLKVTLNVGVAGTLLKKDGNCMPMIDSSGSSCRTYPVRRTIMIYEYTTLNQVDGWGPSYNSVHSKLVAECDADQDGFFQVMVNPGTYSVFIKENEKFYASISDGQGGIHPVTVKDDSVNIVTLFLDYAAY